MTEASQPTTGAAASGLSAYLRDLVNCVGAGRTARAVLLLLGGTAAESLGLLVLVPLLQLVNGQAATPAMRWLQAHGLHAELGPLLAAFALLMLLRAWLLRRRDLALLALRLDYVNALRQRVESALAAASWPFLVRLRHADVMHLLFDHLDRINQGTHQLMQLLAGAGMALAGCAILAIVAPAWTLGLLVPFAAVAWLLRRRLAATAAMGGRLLQGQRAQMTSASRLLAGLKLVKAHSMESRHLVELTTERAQLRREQLHFAEQQSRTRGWFEVGGAGVLCVLLYGASVWGQLGLAELLLLVLVFARLLPFLRDAQLQLQQLAHMRPAFDGLQHWARRCEAAAEPALAEATERPRLVQSLRMAGVGFSYTAEGPAALVDVSLEIEAGTTTAIVGASGSGKSTLADVALGLLEPNTGCVLVDGLALSDGNARRRWRQSVAYVAQDTYLFPGTIRANLCWLAGDASDDEVWQALHKADAADFVAALAGGLDHMLHERGEGLSGGQRQRLALARALLRRPELLVLDEVTAHLDPETEDRVLAALRRLRGQMTIITIAHREAARRYADRTITLVAGRIVEERLER